MNEENYLLSDPLFMNNRTAEDLRNDCNSANKKFVETGKDFQPFMMSFGTRKWS